jgi:hypothetical protein
MIPAGTIAGHVLGYLAAGDDPAFSNAHSHLRPAAWLAAALALGSLAFLASVRTRPIGRGLSLSRMVGAQVALFAALEIVEHLHSGPAALLGDASFRWGIAAQLVSATVLLAFAALARVSGERLRALLAGRRPHARSSRRRPWCALPATIRSSTASCSVSERGPPRLLVSA